MSLVSRLPSPLVSRLSSPFSCREEQGILLLASVLVRRWHRRLLAIDLCIREWGVLGADDIGAVGAVDIGAIGVVGVCLPLLLLVLCLLLLHLIWGLWFWV